jgi:hypothetical protein
LTPALLTEYEHQARLDLQHPKKRRQSLTSLLPSSLPSSLRLFNSLLYTSRYFTSKSLSLLFSSFPVSSLHTIDHFTLSFATYFHGYSLHSLYQLTPFFAPTILLLRSVEKKVTIGVFIDDSISPPRREVRGKGKGGIFRLDEETCRWYGTATERIRREHQESLRRRSDGEGGEVSEGDELLATATEGGGAGNDSQSKGGTGGGSGRDVLKDIFYQYCVSQHDALIFGGSLEHGSNAIRICGDLRTCSCGPSDTYENPCLVPEETDPFIIGEFPFPLCLSLALPLNALSLSLSLRGCGGLLWTHCC